jgi:AAA+ superfamily predicted ATPase
VIRGGPGVGKTMFAKILSRIYLCLGVTSKSTFKIIKRTDLIGEFLGHTAMKTQQAINEALGGVLFIDEAYSIGSNSKSGNGDSYSKECIDVLTQNLSEHKGNLICIIAGYEDQLEKNFFSLNPGLKRRFGFYYDLKDYTPEELTDIFISKVNRMNGWKLDKEAISWLKKEKLFNKNMKYFPFFGGDIDNLITRIKLFHSHRVFGKNALIHKNIDKSDILGGFDTFKKEYNNVHQNTRDNHEKKNIIMDMYI